jgi:hypothetical protein
MTFIIFSRGDSVPRQAEQGWAGLSEEPSRARVYRQKTEIGANDLQPFIRQFFQGSDGVLAADTPFSTSAFSTASAILPFS